jgi:hypothetical protein
MEPPQRLARALRRLLQILTEAEPGLFTRPGATGMASRLGPSPPAKPKSGLSKIRLLTRIAFEFKTRTR